MAFLIGLVAIPAAIGSFLLYDAMVTVRPCKEVLLGCIGELLLFALTGAVVAGVLAALASRRVTGWPWLMVGLLGGVTAVAVYNGGGRGLEVVAAQVGTISVFFAVPSTVAYFVTLIVGKPLGLRPTVPATAGDGEMDGGGYWDGTRWGGIRP